MEFFKCSNVIIFLRNTIRLNIVNKIQFLFKDIRSYFSKVDGKQDNPNKINSSQKKNTKKRLILSSDEEDDVEPCGSVVKPQEQKSEKRICVNPVDVFGSNPVKQKPINVIRPPQKTQVIII